MRRLFQATKITVSALKAIVEYWTLHQKNQGLL